MTFWDFMDKNLGELMVGSFFLGVFALFAFVTYIH